MWAVQRDPFGGKGKLLHLCNQERGTMSGGPVRIWRQSTPHLGVLFQPIYRATQKAANSEWGPEPEKALQQVWAALQAAIPLGPCDPADACT